MAQQLTITIGNRPGALAQIAEVLARNKINITGLDSSGPQRQIRLLVSSVEKARRALREAGLQVRVDGVVVLNLAHRAGTLARAARKLGDRKININYAYGTAARGGKRAEVVLGVANPHQAARLLG